MRSNTTVLVLDAGCDDGRRIAAELLDAGCRVAVTDRRAAALGGILPGHGRRVLAVAADVDDAAQVERLIGRVEARFGAIDSVVCPSCADGVTCLHLHRVLRVLARDRRALA